MFIDDGEQVDGMKQTGCEPFYVDDRRFDSIETHLLLHFLLHFKFLALRSREVDAFRTRTEYQEASSRIKTTTPGTDTNTRARCRRLQSQKRLNGTD